MSEEIKDVKKVIPSKLERKFADFNYKFAKYFPDKTEPNTITYVGFIIGIIGSIAFVLSSYNKYYSGCLFSCSVQFKEKGSKFISY